MNELPPLEIDPKTFLRQHCTLPALPQVLMQVQEAVHSEDVSVGEITKIVGKDPAMSAQVLKVVNSSYYSLPREIVDIKLAVAYLGISEIYRIVLSMAVVNTLAPDRLKGFQKIWFHSVYTALCARHLAKEFEPLVTTSELWVAALLHDVGKLVYVKFFPDHIAAIENLCADKGVLFCEAEKALKLPASSYLGTLLCEHWRLPDRIKDACESHTLFDLPNLMGTSERAALLRVIALANILTILSTEPLAEEKTGQLSRIASKILQLKEQQFVLLMATISELKLEAEQLS